MDRREKLYRSERLRSTAGLMTSLPQYGSTPMLKLRNEQMPIDTRRRLTDGRIVQRTMHSLPPRFSARH